jgi:hypothetical protein
MPCIFQRATSFHPSSRLPWTVRRRVPAESANRVAIRLSLLTNLLPKRCRTAKTSRTIFSPAFLFKFANGIDFEIDTNEPAMQALPSKRQAKKMRGGNNNGGSSSGVDTEPDSAADSEAGSEDVDEAASGARATSNVVGASPPPPSRKPLQMQMQMQNAAS